MKTLKSVNRMLDKVRKEDEIITTVQKKNLPVDLIKENLRKECKNKGDGMREKEGGERDRMKRKRRRCGK